MSLLTRAQLRLARDLLAALEAEDGQKREAAEPGAYAYVQDQIERLTRGHRSPPVPHGATIGQPVRLRCSATGRYVGAGLGLYVSAQDNDLCLDQVDRDGAPAKGLPLPTDDAVAGAAAMLIHLLPGAL
jgi:hypothetical protein